MTSCRRSFSGFLFESVEVLPWSFSVKGVQGANDRIYGAFEPACISLEIPYVEDLTASSIDGNQYLRRYRTHSLVPCLREHLNHFIILHKTYSRSLIH